MNLYGKIIKSLSNLEKLKILYNNFKSNSGNLETKWINFFEDLDEEAIDYLHSGQLDLNRNSKSKNNSNCGLIKEIL